MIIISLSYLTLNHSLSLGSTPAKPQWSPVGKCTFLHSFGFGIHNTTQINYSLSSFSLKSVHTLDYLRQKCYALNPFNDLVIHLARMLSWSVKVALPLHFLLAPFFLKLRAVTPFSSSPSLSVRGLLWHSDFHTCVHSSDSGINLVSDLNVS